MSDTQEYRLTIDVFTPATISMARLAEYMAELARLFGEHENVHFSHLELGSAVLVSKIERHAIPKVVERLLEVQHGAAPKEAMHAYKAIDMLLAKDNAVATLDQGTSNIIRFPGRTRPKPARYGPFREESTLDGVVIRIGGRDSTIPVWIEDADGTEYVCQTSLELSKRLAPLYRAATIRVFGSGKWIREEDRSWTLQQFDINDFEILDDAPLVDVVAKLRAIEGGSWDKNTIVGDMLAFRSDEESAR